MSSTAWRRHMVVDMGVEAWNYTLDANLVSNYFLMHHVAPLMKAQGGGGQGPRRGGMFGWKGRK